MFDTPKRIALGIAIALPAAATTAAAQPVAADSAPSTTRSPDALNYCVTRAQSVQEIKRGEVAQFRCYSTFPEAMSAQGIPTQPGDTPETYDARVRAAAATAGADGAMTSAGGNDFVLAYHYGVDNAPQGTLPVYMPTGPSCNDYGINIAGTYVDNWIRTTRPGPQPTGCPKVKHYDAAGFGQGNTQTTDANNITLLGAMSHATSSLVYKNS